MSPPPATQLGSVVRTSCVPLVMTSTPLALLDGISGGGLALCPQTVRTLRVLAGKASQRFRQRLLGYGYTPRRPDALFPQLPRRGPGHRGLEREVPRAGDRLLVTHSPTPLPTLIWPNQATVRLEVRD